MSRGTPVEPESRLSGSPGGSIRLVRRATVIERQTVLRRYQWVRRVLPAVAGGVCTASRAEKGEGASPKRGQAEAHPQRSPLHYFIHDSAANDRTERRGRPNAFALATEVARPRSL